MLAAVYKGQQTIAVEEVAVPELRPDQVLLEISHCGICGSDLHLLYEDMGRPGSIAGHEYSGVVALVGDAVEGWAAGDRAVGGPAHGCGQCPACAAGRPNLCSGRPRSGIDPFVGAFAEYRVMDAATLYRIPDDLDLRTAALTEPVAVALHGVGRASVSPSTRALVTGAGPIGLLTIAVLRARQVEDITVSEPNPRRRSLAEEIGAARVVEPGELGQPDFPMDLVADPYQVAFECSGRADAMELALANLDRAGIMVLSGTGMKRPRLDPNRIILNELTVTGTVEYTPDDYAASIELLASGRLPTDVLIEPEDQPLERVEWAVRQLGEGVLAGKVMIAPHGAPPA